MSFDEAPTVTPQTQKGPKCEERTLKSENVVVLFCFVLFCFFFFFFFFPFGKINKYIDLFTIQVRAL